MKVTMTEQTSIPAFKPLKIEILLETKEEAVGFAHLVGCSNYRNVCTENELVNNVRSTLAPIADTLPTKM